MLSFITLEELTEDEYQVLVDAVTMYIEVCENKDAYEEIDLCYSLLDKAESIEYPDGHLYSQGRTLPPIGETWTEVLANTPVGTRITKMNHCWYYDPEEILNGVPVWRGRLGWTNEKPKC